jgi:hypothetical protein
MDPDPAIYIINLQDANKNKNKNYSAYYLLLKHMDPTDPDQDQQHCLL